MSLSTQYTCPQEGREPTVAALPMRRSFQPASGGCGEGERTWRGREGEGRRVKGRDGDKGKGELRGREEGS